MTPKIFLDLDGVMVNLELPIYEQHGVIFGKTQEWELEKVWPKCGMEFWANLPPMDDHDALYSIVREFNPVVLTAYPHTFKHGSSDAVQCELGKRRWVYKNLGAKQAVDTIVTLSKIKQEVIPVDAKDKSSYILIDDMPRNITRWRAAGGTGILHKSAIESITALQNELRVLSGVNNFTSSIESL